MGIILGWPAAKKSVKPWKTGTIDRVLCLWALGAHCRGPRWGQEKQGGLLRSAATDDYLSS